VLIEILASRLLLDDLADDRLLGHVVLGGREGLVGGDTGLRGRSLGPLLALGPFKGGLILFGLLLDGGNGSAFDQFPGNLAGIPRIRGTLQGQGALRLRLGRLVRLQGLFLVNYKSFKQREVVFLCFFSPSSSVFGTWPAAFAPLLLNCWGSVCKPFRARYTTTPANKK